MRLGFNRQPRRASRRNWQEALESGRRQRRRVPTLPSRHPKVTGGSAAETRLPKAGEELLRQTSQRTGSSPTVENLKGRTRKIIGHELALAPIRQLNL